MDFEIRVIEPDAFDTYMRTLEMAFSGSIAPDELANERSVAEFDRMHAAFDDDEIVGGTSAASFTMTVPGGRGVRAAGVTGVGVLPSHRRRGINTALMRHQLDDVRARGEALAVLYASEGGIYGRYGYGLATFLSELNVETAHARFVRGYRPGGRVRLFGHDDALANLKPIYDTAAAVRPGMIAMDDAWRRWRWTELKRDEDNPHFFAVHASDAGEPDAYAVYQVKHEWPDSLPRLVLSVSELIALTPQAYADMWRFVFDIDLVDRVKAWNRPVDEPLLHLMAEPRQLRATIADAVWARLVDVDAALGARGYAADGELVIDVRDPFCPWNEGRHVLTVRDGQGTCAPTDAAPDLACTVNDLGAIYLGGTTLRRLHRAGQIEEITAGALERADAVFASDPAPWSSFLF
jgi:predicted acetyltransferase